jgi:hypothetical protein
MKGAMVVAGLALTIASATMGLTAEMSSGSGVVIGTGGEILTNSHVVEDCQSITVRLPSGEAEKAIMVANDPRNDLAVVRLPSAPSSVAVFRDGPVRAGDAVVALGYPLPDRLATSTNISVGNVSALAGLDDDSRYIQISAPVQPGNSGGPLLDASGHLAGIVTAKLDALRALQATGDIPQNVNFALKAEVARTFLDSKGIGYRNAHSDQQLAPADVAEIGRPVTVFILCKANSQSAAAPEKKKSAPERKNPPVQSAAAPPVPTTNTPGHAPCEDFRKLPDGTWVAVKGIKINHGWASGVINPGTIIIPGTMVAGANVYAALQKNCR